MYAGICTHISNLYQLSLSACCIAIIFTELFTCCATFVTTGLHTQLKILTSLPIGRLLVAVIAYFTTTAITHSKRHHADICQVYPHTQPVQHAERNGKARRCNANLQYMF